MASNEHDDLLESFINNSSKAYNDDIKERNNNNKESSQSKKKEYSDQQRGRNIEKKIIARNEKLKRKYNNDKPGNKLASFFMKSLLAIVMIVAVVGIVCGSIIAIYGYSVVYGDPVFDLTEESLSQNQTSFIYGYDDDKIVEMTRLHGEENRIWVDLDEISPYLPQAFIAIEDKRFEKHHGVDWRRTISVLVIPENFGQGGSTLTQQLIKNITDDNKVTFVRKFNEILRALNIERNYSKEEILEAYLNTIYLSNGCYGVKTAAELYFGKEVSDLNAAECAVLASITKAPTDFDPFQNPDNNRTRQLEVLKQMHHEDNGFLNDQQYKEAVDYELIFTNSKKYKGSQLKNESSKKVKDDITNYYVDHVITSVSEDLQKLGYTKKKAHDLIYGGGLKIYAAVDFDVQESLEDVYENYKRMPDETVQGAMCIMDYKGRILGVIGGTGKNKGSLLLNRATMSTRPPGSSIKPLSVYAPALEKSKTDNSINFTWSTIVKDSPLMKVEGKPWPHNQGGSYSSNNVTIAYAIQKSLNTVAARVVDEIGVDYSYNFISENFKLSTLDDIRDADYGPLSLGSLTNGATVLDLTAAYASFGNGGLYYQPYCYYKVEDSQGNIILEQKPDKTSYEAISEGTSWVMNKLLQSVMTNGTGASYKLSGIECFGKTGTTNDDKDRWFVGGTPNFVAAVWYGYDEPKEVRYNLSSNPSGTIWKTVMGDIYDKLDNKGTDYNKSFPKSDLIVQRAFCSYCGKLTNGKGTYGWYEKDNLPGYCSGHKELEEQEEKEKEEKDKSEKTSSSSDTEKTSKATTKKSSANNDDNDDE